MTGPSGQPPDDQYLADDEAKELAAGEERLNEPVVRHGMFGTHGTGDTSGYGGLVVRQPPPFVL